MNRAPLVMVCAVAVASMIAGRGKADEVTAVPAEPTYGDCLIEARSTVDLGSAEEGIIHEILVERGDFVAQGERVARLDFELAERSVELAQLRAGRTVELRDSQTRLEFQRREMARIEELHDKQVVSAQSLDEAETELGLALQAVEAAEFDLREAEVELRRAQANLDRHVIRSPVTGVVSEVLMEPGEYAFEQSPIMQIAEFDPLHVEVFLPVSYYREVVEGMVAEVMPEPPVEGTYQARVTVVDRIFDSASGTFGVRLELPNPDFEIPAGLRCTVRFDRDVDGARFSAWSAMDFEISGIGDAVDAAELPLGPIDGPMPVLVPTASGGEERGAQPEDGTPVFDDDLTLLIQQKLAGVGFEVGPLDGLLGPRTTEAIKSYQVQHGLAPDGRSSRVLFDHLSDVIRQDAEGGGEAADGPSAFEFSTVGYDFLRQAAAASDRGDGRLAAFFYSKALAAGDLPSLYQAYAHNNRGALEQVRGQSENALHDFDRAIALHPDYVAAYVNRAESRFVTGRYALAIDDYDHAIRRAPDLAYAFYRRGMAQAELGETESAIESYDAAIAQSLDLVEAYWARGKAYQFFGRHDEALSDFAIVFEHDPRYPGLRSQLQDIGALECEADTVELCFARGQHSSRSNGIGVNP